MSEGGPNGDFWDNQRIMVTGGGGFLGSHVVERLQSLGAGELFVPRKADYDLVNNADIKRLLSDSKLKSCCILQPKQEALAQIVPSRPSSSTTT